MTYPNLKGIIPDKAVTVVQQLATALTTLQTQFSALSAQPLVLKPDADAAYGPAAQQKALQVSGSNPLNLAGLIGTPGVLTNGFTGTRTISGSTLTFVNGVLTKIVP